MDESKSNLIWIDLEMTGLDTQRDHIIEIAIVITDNDLNQIAEKTAVIAQPDTILAGMDEWNQTQHSKSGLIEEVKQSTNDYATVEQSMLAFVSQHVEPGVSPMCGNSICQDRRFLFRLMPELEKFFHYRNLDVSTIKELMRRWAPDDPATDAKPEGDHRALQDIRAAIDELKDYRATSFTI